MPVLIDNEEEDMSEVTLRDVHDYVLTTLDGDSDYDVNGIVSDLLACYNLDDFEGCNLPFTRSVVPDDVYWAIVADRRL